MLRVLNYSQLCSRYCVVVLSTFGREPLGTANCHSLIRHRSSTATAAVREVYRDDDNNRGASSRKSGIITVPLRLQERLKKKVIRDNTKWALRRRFIEASRKGSKEVVITARRAGFNHYYGQSYPSNESVPLVSKGWAHRKAGVAHDYFKIHAHGKNIALPELEDQVTFSNLGLKPNIVDVLEQNGIRHPTKIQTFAIPKLLKGLNCLISAETGCGKTLTYLLPVFQLILEAQRRRNFKPAINSPLALILVPTRELASQVAAVAENLGAKFDLKVKLLQGGNLGSKIKSPPAAHIDLLVSTVKVIKEMTKFEIYSVRKLLTIILDEADTLTDDSFCEEVVDFLQPIPFIGENKVQIGFVSATLPTSLETVLGEKLALLNLVRVTTPGLHMVMRHVPQTFLRVKKSEKSTKIVDLLKKDIEQGISTIVFCNTFETCAWLASYLGTIGIACISLNAGMLPRERKAHLESFMSRDIPVLVATDLGSRGLDTIQTGHVINYDFPAFIADYVHRCGRTGRVGSKVSGRVTSLIAWSGEAALVMRIETAVRKETCFQRVDANIKKHLNAKYGYGLNQPILPMNDSFRNEDDVEDQ